MTTPHDRLAGPDEIDAALALYDPRLPYHNANHALAVRAVALRLARAAIGAGHRVDLRVVELAALLHDADYAGGPAHDKEEHSAARAVDLLACRHHPQQLQDAVRSAILATAAHTTPDTIEGHCVRTADLLPLAAPWPVFAANAHLLRAEARLLGTWTGEQAWLTGTRRALGTYLDGPLWLPDPDAVKNWRSTAQTNLARLLADDTR